MTSTTITTSTSVLIAKAVASSLVRGDVFSVNGAVGLSEQWMVRSDPYLTGDRYVQFTAVSLETGKLKHFSLAAGAEIRSKKGVTT